MLVPPPRASVDHGQPVVAPRLVEQLAAEMHGPRRSTGRHQRIVEALVPLAPFALDADRVVLPWGAELVEQEIRTHDLGLPGVGAVADRLGHRPGLKPDAQLAELEEVGQRDRPHPEPTPALGPPHPFPNAYP